jgi:filamentous hemagglutinin family protein
MKLAKSILATQQSNNPVGKRLVRPALRTHEGRIFYQKILFSAIACLMSGAVFAAPQSGQVVEGVSTISTPDANTTVITQSTDKSIINWQSFSIGADEFVQFVQPDTHSVSLNQIIGGNPSSILGSLSANGQVYLVNPNGIYFGQGVQVDVSGITASVLGINNNDFMNGEYVFTKDTNVPFATVVNEGAITAQNNGYVVLFGDYIQNTGVIQAQMGKVVLASGSKVTIDISGNNLVSVVVNEAAVSQLTGVSNSGGIHADGGRVIMTAKVAGDLVSSAVNNTGLIQAHSVADHDGAIFLTALGGDINNSGGLDASAKAESNVDGGGVLAYSDKNITLSSGAQVKANGDGIGSGGVVRVIAEDQFDFMSSSKISVEGADQKGGFIEISGHGGLSVQGDVELGSGGSLLIDPADLNIIAGSAVPTSAATSSSVGSGFVQGVLNDGSDVSLIASNSITADTGVSISATDTGAGDLSILIGTVSDSGGDLGGEGVGDSAQCDSAGFCVPDTDNGNSLFTPGANGSINLGHVTFNLAGGLNVAGGTSSGDVDLGGIFSATSGVSITAARDIGISGINAPGYISIAADSDSSGSGNVLVGGVSISTLGDLAISGANISNIGTVISASNLTFNATNDITINGAVLATTNAASYTANGDIIESGSYITADGNIAYSAANISMTGSLIASEAGLSLMAAGNISASGAALTGAGMYMSAGNNLDLKTSPMTIGAGTVSGVSGDAELLSVLSAAGVALPALTDPNGKFVAGGTLEMGSVALSGSKSYLWFNADSVTMGTVTAPNESTLLVQYSPFTTTNTIGLGDAQDTNYGHAAHISGIPATTIAIGGSQQTGNIIVGTNEALDVGSKNLIFVSPTGNITGEDNVITTGIVASHSFGAVLESTITITSLLADTDVDDDENKVGEEGEDVQNDKLADGKTNESGMCTAV